MATGFASKGLHQEKNLQASVFVALFLFRYVRAGVNIVANRLYRPVAIPEKPTYHPADLTVVIATVSLNTPTFHKVVESILAHPIRALIISTAGVIPLTQSSAFQEKFSDCRITILNRGENDRRKQTAEAMPLVRTKLMAISDDHTYWPGDSRFVPSMVAPFEDPNVGAVGPVLKARHHHHPIGLAGFFNFLGATYLLRMAHDFLATNTIDEGTPVLPSRFAVFRTTIYADKEFLHQYLNEYIFFGKVGPLNADDDNFHTRWLTNHGWTFKLQGGSISTMTTELGEYPKFLNQCVRWTRTTWRSNPRALFIERTTWKRFPYTTYSLLYALVRMPLFYEIALFWFLWKALKEAGCAEWFTMAAWTLLIWCMTMKLVKILPHFKRYPKDLVYLPAYIIFGWFISFVKVFSLVTCWNTYWATAAIDNPIKDKDTISVLNSAEMGKVQAAVIPPALHGDDDHPSGLEIITVLPVTRLERPAARKRQTAAATSAHSV